MKPTKEQKAQWIASLNVPYGAVQLLCDGVRISLQVERASKNAVSYRVMTYVDGWFKGEWTSSKEPRPEHKFLRKSVISLVKPGQKAKDEKKFGKRAIKSMANLYDAKCTLFMPDWRTGKAAIDHLCRVCESVEEAPTLHVADVKNVFSTEEA